MKVRDLIALLQAEDPAREVVMSKDAEGNHFSPLSNASRNRYRAETTWYGEIGLEELTQEMIEGGYAEEDVMRDGVPALVFWPVN